MHETGLRSISIDRKNPRHVEWWSKIWKDRGFEHWGDAKGWLWDLYRAEVCKTNDGFVIRFIYDEEATLFRLTWP